MTIQLGQNMPWYLLVLTNVIVLLIQEWFAHTDKTPAISLLNWLKLKLFKTGETKMLEGKEIQGSIPGLGSYGVDIDDKGMVDAELALSKQVSPFLSAGVSISIKGDLVGAVLDVASKSSSPLVKNIASKLALITGRALPAPVAVAPQA